MCSHRHMTAVGRRAWQAGLSAICIPFVALQVYGTDCSTRTWQIRRLQRDVECLRLMIELGLSASQKAQLTPIVREAMAAERDYEQAVADLTPEMLEAYGDLKTQAQENAGFTDDVTERAEDCSRLGRGLRLPLREELTELEGQVRAVLTPKQLALVGNYQPRRSKHLGPGGTQSRKSRSGPGRRRREMGQGGRGGPREEWTTIQNLMLCPVSLSLLDPQAQAAETLPLDHPETQAAMARVHDLETDLRILNLVNALNLAASQMQRLVELAGQAQTNRGRDGAAASCEKLTAQREALLQAREDLLTQGEISRATHRRLRSAVGDRLPGQPGRGRMGKTSAGRTRLISEAEELLTNGQRIIVSEHKPYLVCPETVRDPARAGQVAKPSFHTTLLERLRRCPPGLVESRVERFVKGEGAKAGSRTPAERQARIDQIVALVRKASAMSDVDFALCKDQLADEIQSPYARGRPSAGGPDLIRAVIGRCLLNERTVPLLKERIDGNQ